MVLEDLKHPFVRLFWVVESSEAVSDQFVSFGGCVSIFSVYHIVFIVVGVLELFLTQLRAAARAGITSFEPRLEALGAEVVAAWGDDGSVEVPFILSASRP